jgi:hypothetical protein
MVICAMALDLSSTDFVLLPCCQRGMVDLVLDM